MREGGVEFRVGEVFATSFAVMIRNMVPFGMLAIGTYAASRFLETWLASLHSAAPEAITTDTSALAVNALIAFLGIPISVLMIVVYAALTFATTEDLRGRPVELGACARQGLRAVLPLLGVMFLIILGIGLASLLLLIPGLILYVTWWLAIPVAVVERLGIVASLRRSAELTKGHRWRIFGLSISMFIAGAIVVAITGMIGAADGSVVGWMLASAAGAFLSALHAVAGAVGYCRLRAEKSGIAKWSTEFA